MKITIQSPGFKATRHLQKFVDIHVRTLESLYDRILESRVCLKTDNSDKAEAKVCELQVVIPGNDLFASKRGSTFEEAAVRAVAAVKHQMDKVKALTNR
jgi:putative sigma-54 modulation protein